MHVFKLETTPEADDSSWSGYVSPPAARRPVVWMAFGCVRPRPWPRLMLLHRVFFRRYLTSGLTSVASMLPSAMTEVWTQSRSFAQVQLEKPVANLAALISNPAKEMPELVIVTEQYEICALPRAAPPAGVHFFLLFSAHSPSPPF